MIFLIKKDINKHTGEYYGKHISMVSTLTEGTDKKRRARPKPGWFPKISL